MKILFLLFLFSSCAVVHHVQVGELDYLKGHQRIPFEVKVSETGFDFSQAADIGSKLTKGSKTSKRLGTLSDIVELFQYGPKTGYTVYNDTYADKIIYGIYEKCPSGKVTGLAIVREMRKYPVVSGEIVKVTGYCLQKNSKKRMKKVSKL